MICRCPTFRHRLQDAAHALEHPNRAAERRQAAGPQPMDAARRRFSGGGKPVRGCFRFDTVGGDLGGMTAALVRVEMVNGDAKPHQFVLRCDSGSWGENPAWVDWTRTSATIWWPAGTSGPTACWSSASAPTPIRFRPMVALRAKNMVLVWNLKAGDKRTAGSSVPTAAIRPTCPPCENRTGRAKWNKAGRSGATLLAAHRSQDPRRGRVERLSGPVSAICSSCASPSARATSAACPVPKATGRAIRASRFIWRGPGSERTPRGIGLGYRSLA